MKSLAAAVLALMAVSTGCAPAGPAGPLTPLVVGAEHALDLSPLALERFDRGGERRERFVV